MPLSIVLKVWYRFLHRPKCQIGYNKFFLPYMANYMFEKLFGIFKHFRKLLGAKTYLVIIFTIFASLLESFGLMLVMSIVNSLSGDTGVTENDYIQKFLSSMDLSTSALLLLVVFFFYSKGIMVFLTYRYIAKLKGEVNFKIQSELSYARSELYENHIFTFDKAAYLNQITEQLARVHQAFFFLCQFFIMAFSFIVYMSVAIFISPTISLLLLILGFPVLLLYKKLNSTVGGLSSQLSDLSQQITKEADYFASNIEYISSTSKVAKNQEFLFSFFQNFRDSQVRIGFYTAITNASREVVVLSLILAIGIISNQILGQSVGTLIVVFALFYRALNSLMAVQGNMQATLEFGGAVELVLSSLESYWQADLDNLINRVDLKKSFEFRNLNVALAINNEANHQTSITISRGEKIVLMGESGSGKTTLMRQLMGVRPLEKAELFIDGLKINNIFRWRSFGYVAQDPYLCNGTIAEFLIGDLSITKDALERELRYLKFCDFIWDRPEGLDSMIDMQGLSLSGGQKQRLSIAKEIIRKPDVLFFDEATSALDSVNEANVLRCILDYCKKTTIIFVTHRMEVVKYFDSVAIIKNQY